MLRKLSDASASLSALQHSSSAGRMEPQVSSQVVWRIRACCWAPCSISCCGCVRPPVASHCYLPQACPGYLRLAPTPGSENPFPGVATRSSSIGCKIFSAEKRQRWFRAPPAPSPRPHLSDNVKPHDLAASRQLFHEQISSERLFRGAATWEMGRQLQHFCRWFQDLPASAAGERLAMAVTLKKSTEGKLMSRATSQTQLG